MFVVSADYENITELYIYLYTEILSARGYAFLVCPVGAAFPLGKGLYGRFLKNRSVSASSAYPISIGAHPTFQKSNMNPIVRFIHAVLLISRSVKYL
jgi:hypothetical protein